MNAVTSWMFHYVRPSGEQAEFPHLKGFSLVEFCDFLDTVGQRGRVLDPREFLDMTAIGVAPPPGTNLLTFDDGVLDHYRWVFPELRKRGLSALFFVSSRTLERDALLRVHKIHALYGLKGYPWLRREFLSHAKPVMGDAPASVWNDSRATAAYPYDDALTAGFKYALNYVLPPAEVEAVLDRIIADSLPESSLASQFYLSVEHIREMAAHGMHFGYHGHTHRPFAQLSSAELEQEMEHSRRLLDPLLPRPPACLSYPYGDSSSVTEENVALLQRLGIRAAFMAESGTRPPDSFHLPRIDCAEWRRLRNS